MVRYILMPEETIQKIKKGDKFLWMVSLIRMLPES